MAYDGRLDGRLGEPDTGHGDVIEERKKGTVLKKVDETREWNEREDRGMYENSRERKYPAKQ